ncbi:RNA polymerase sigma factor [Dyadobacter sp. CY323]|uniref:RNA polymerase sigma factor n=1 Tax=Dyadobacter sp. CY323 TaxID=2907302 RepID=UPI001F2F1E28|nr:sigma-70 family RNA polymerase sigma factor [Dyadobacter sp. CY323]MCE6990978.1 sigma-70 family RNA polymerase sigma factor [Dyadobacter sp. CY323]
MSQPDLIPHLFRTEYRKITAVLSKRFGLEHIEIAQDIASDTFLQASETWGINGLPENPTAWLYVVAKNKAKDYLKRNTLFNEKIAQQITYEQNGAETSGAEIDIDLSDRNITDSQLQMMFAICHPSIPAEAQIGLSLHILCGFGVNEIAAAFLTNKETINKRLFRAREKLRSSQVKIEFPEASEIQNRLENVLTTLYLLFNEGYYASGRDVTLRKDVCLEAVRLTNLLLESKLTSLPPVYALLALMCFHASRFEARIDSEGETVLYEDQDEKLWDEDLIRQGELFLNQSSSGNVLSKYHLEAGIAYFHTIKNDTKEKWESILQLYNQLLINEYSPMAALNRTYALSKANGKEIAIKEAEKLNLTTHHLYHALLGELYTGIDNNKAADHFRKSLDLTNSKADQKVILKKLSAISS